MQCYCNLCSIRLGFIGSGTTLVDLTGTTYQLTKFNKHTITPTQSGVISVFSDPNYSGYSQHISSAMASGSTQFDWLGRMNIIWYPGKDIGVKYLNQIPIGYTNVMKVVLPNDNIKIHGYPVDMASITSGNCVSCGVHSLTGST